MNRKAPVPVFKFGCNTYSYVRSHSAEAYLLRLADLGFQEFELTVRSGHLWPADFSAEQRCALCCMLGQRAKTPLGERSHDVA
jgi:hypothetical protein